MEISANMTLQADPGVAQFYKTNHEQQTVDYVLGKEREYFGLTRGHTGDCLGGLPSISQHASRRRAIPTPI